MKLLVLMASCNGGRFIAAQIASIRAQTYDDWELWVRDDASDDDSAALVAALAADDARIVSVRDTLGRLGVAANFACLMQRALDHGADAVAFADQDDIWEVDKLERQLALLVQARQAAGRDRPLLIASDVALIGADGAGLGASFMRRQHIRRPDRPPLSTLLLQNHLPGCCLLVNRALLELALPLPAAAHLHDWWIALCATAAGDSHWIDAPLLRYRQHGGNQVGAGGVTGRALRVAGWLPWLRKMNRIYRTTFAQAAALRRRLQERRPLTSDEQQHRGRALSCIDGLLAIGRYPRPLRPWLLWSGGWRCQNRFMTLLLLLQSAVLRLPGGAADATPGQSGAMVE